MKTLSGGQLAGGNSATERADNDFYTTDPQSVKIFLDKYIKDGENLEGSIYECSCGTGNISEVIKEYYPNNELFSSDLIDRGYGYGNIDFLNYEYKRKFDTIITNPPFSLINDFIKRGLELTNRYLIYFAKIQILEGEDRVGFLKNTPLKYIYVNKKRQATWKNNEPLDPNGKKWATTMMMCWFVWDKEYKGEPIVRWL
jgi:hypothetical protein